jgi:hypothetical protein
MSLTDLVDFAQRAFPDFESAQSDESGLFARIDRPTGRTAPEWLLLRREDQEVRDYDRLIWRVDGSGHASSSLIIPPDPDALAFYLPFHFHRRTWGVYIRLSGVQMLAEFLRGRTLGTGDEPYLYTAERFLREHERFHAACEIASTRAELLAQRPVYGPYFDLYDGSLHEEAMANANALRRCFTGGEDPPGVKATLRHWMDGQGAGYSAYGDFLSGSSFSKGLAIGAEYMATVLQLPAPGRLNRFLYAGVDAYRSMPVTHVNDLDLGSSAVSLLRPFPKAFGLQVLVHSNDHPPPHVHILLDGKVARYRWPQLVPLVKNISLSRRALKNLHSYLAKWGPQIDQRVRDVYGESAARNAQL